MPLRVAMRDSAHQPVLGYQPNVAAVDPVTGEVIDGLLISFDPHRRGSNEIGAGGLGFRKGTPSDASGISSFHLTLIDAVDGTCFRLLAWFKVRHGESVTARALLATAWPALAWFSSLASPFSPPAQMGHPHRHPCSLMLSVSGSAYHDF